MLREKHVEMIQSRGYMLCRADDKNMQEKEKRVKNTEIENSLRKEIYKLRARDRECWQK